MRGTITFLTFCTALAALAQVPCKWTVDLARVTPADWDCLRGETVELMPSFVSGRDVRDLSGVESATLWWQTNGMGAAYWSAPASVDTSSRPHRLMARWTPDMDVGAASYRYFVGAAAPSGTQYRAHGTIRMRGAPGETPNALPLPVQVLDFAKVSVTNAPWGASGLSTNDVRAIVADAGYLQTVSPDGHCFVDWEVNEVGDWHLATDYFDTHFLKILSEFDFLDGGLYSDSSTIFYGDSEKTYDMNFELAVKGDLADYAKTNDLGTAAYKDATEFATAADEALVYQLLMGSNVVAEVTNYNSRVRSPQLRLLQLDPDTHEYYAVWTETNGLSRVANAATNYTDAAVAALADVYAPRAWSRSTSGLGAEAPSNTTWISTPETVIAGGYEYAKRITSHGEVWVLCSNGLGLGADTNSYFCVTDGAGETLFSIEKTDSVLVGVDADGISVSGGVVTIPLNVVSQEPPVCYACTSLVNPTWVDLSETTPAWVTASSVTATAGGWQWTIETSAPSAFFQFRVLQEGSTVIRNNAQTDLSQGILVNGTRFYPHINNGTLTWTTTP